MGCGTHCKDFGENPEYRGYPEPCGYCHKHRCWLYDYDEENEYEPNETIPLEECEEYKEYLFRHQKWIDMSPDERWRKMQEMKF